MIFCDVLNLDFDLIAEKLQGLDPCKNSKELTSSDLSKVFSEVFEFMLGTHILLSSEKIVYQITRILCTPINTINTSREIYLRNKRCSLEQVFSHFILLRMYVDEIINGNSAFINKQTFYSYIANVLQCELPPPSPYSSKYNDSIPSKNIDEIFNNFKNNIGVGCIANTRRLCTDSMQYMVGALYSILENNFVIKRCSNCEKYFVPLKRSDTIYCDRISPQDSTRSCREYGSQKLWYDRIKEDEAKKLARNIYMAKQMLVKRNPDRPEYKEMFEYFKAQRKIWEDAVNAGTRERSEYILWLKEMKEKKVLKNGQH